MQLRTRKLISPELTRDGDNSNCAPDRIESEVEGNAPADGAANQSGASMDNCDAQIISAGLGGYGLPAPSSYDDDDWKSDSMLLAWAPWFNSTALEHEYIVPQYAVDGWLPGVVPLAATQTWACRKQFA